MFGFHSNGGMYWGSTTSYSMSLTKAGELKVFNSLAVGGNLKSGSKMSVKGKLSATEVEVTNSNWPDYVFEENYTLSSLKEIEAYIKANKHLPEVPSAEQVAEEGVSLGAMNAILLKKIEELTLHLIEKDKQIDNLNNRVNRLEK